MLHRNFLACFVGLLVMGGVTEASAAGLVFEESADIALTRGPQVLFGMSSMSVDARLDDELAIIREVRRYGPEAGYQSSVPVGTATFFRAVPPGTDVRSFRVGGVEVGGEVVSPEVADGIRIARTRALHQPGPLRELGMPMFVSRTITLDIANPFLEIELDLETPLTSRDSMEGATIPVDWHHQPVGSVDVRVSAKSSSPVRALYAPFHQLTVTRASELELSGTYSGWQVAGSLPLTLLRSTGDELIHIDVLPYRYDDADGFVMLLVSPALTHGQESAARDIVFAIDTSGSMKGEKLTQARNALTGVLGRLGGEDRFAIVTFDKEVELSPGGVQSATEEAVGTSSAFVTELSAGGGTNLSGGLATAFASFPVTGPERPRYVVLLTDGQPTEGETDKDTILDHAEAQNELGARIFTFGIGNDVNALLLDQLAEQSGGSAIYIRPGASIEVAVDEFFDSIEAPVLTDPSLDLASAGLSAVYPQVLPDLYAGQTTSIVARYRPTTATGTARLILRGQQGANSSELVYDLALPEFSVKNGHSPRVWATRRIADLLQQKRLGNDDPALLEEAVALSRRYGIITSFTSYSVDDGDATVIFDGISDDQTGEEAVETSISIHEEAGAGTYGAAYESFVRYFSDRTLLRQDGWFTDTSIGDDPQWVDVHFGSDAYFALADGEGLPLAGFVSLAPNARFEWLGRNFRITDAASVAEGAELPPESEIPAAASRPDATQGRVELVVERFDAPDGTGSGDGRRGASYEPAPSQGGCSTASSARLQLEPLGIAAVLLAATALAIRRRRQ